MRSWRLTLLLGWGLALAPAAVQAQDYQSVKANAAEAFKAGNYDDAANLFREAFQIEPRGNLLYNIGLCYEKANDFNNAVVFYQRFVEAVPGSAKRPAVQQKISALKQQLESQYEDVSVSTSPPGAIIFVDDKARGAMGAAPITFKLLPGDYTVIAELEGYEPTTKRITLQQGQPAIVDLTLLASGSVGQISLMVSERDADVMIDGKRVGRSPLTEPIRLSGGPHDVMVVKPGFSPWKQTVTVEPGNEAQRVKVSLKGEGVSGLDGGSSSSSGGGSIWPWVTMGVGVAALGGATLTGLSAQDLHDQLAEKQDKGRPIAGSDIDKGNNLSLYTNVLMGVGVAALVGGVAWWLLDDGVETVGSVQTSFGVTPDGDPAVSFGGTF